ncbi:hypothetical protein CDAR_167391 [Caerostris darwini]|uniref:DUF5641 domain-containing protein n=1 Tax=Caerostris darwini TaxID=1538125 RepID=A0AAV4QDZ1_9ARAC|nr:hypothetical protein CDAR_167391 [Caerostris darwini]
MFNKYYFTFRKLSLLPDEPANTFSCVRYPIELDGKLFKTSVRFFWKSWRREYLHSLQQRTKWRKSEENLQVGDPVMIKESNLPSATWPLARIPARISVYGCSQSEPPKDCSNAMF